MIDQKPVAASAAKNPQKKRAFRPSCCAVSIILGGLAALTVIILVIWASNRTPKGHYGKYQKLIFDAIDEYAKISKPGAKVLRDNIPGFFEALEWAHDYYESTGRHPTGITFGLDEVALVSEPGTEKSFQELATAVRAGLLSSYKTKIVFKLYFDPANIRDYYEKFGLAKPYDLLLELESSDHPCRIWFSLSIGLCKHERSIVRDFCTYHDIVIKDALSKLTESNREQLQKSLSRMIRRRTNDLIDQVESDSE